MEHSSVEKRINEMSNFEMARWASLIDAVDLIAEKAEDKKQDFNKIELKPLEITRYVEGTCDSLAMKIERERNELRTRA